MDFKDITKFLTGAAPMIATALGGPLAGGAVNALEGVFGINSDPSVSKDDRLAAIATAFSGATPDQLLAIKKAEQDYAIQMATLGYKNVADLEGIAAGDRDSARKREEAVKDCTPRNLAYAITVGYFVVLGVLMFGNVPSSSKDILYIMLGTLGTAWTGAISYYFGSTSGSSEKTKLLAASTPVKE